MTYSGPIIDCDVHHDWATPEHLHPYLSTGWQEYVKGPGRLYGGGESIPLFPAQLIPNPTGTIARRRSPATVTRRPPTTT